MCGGGQGRGVHGLQPYLTSRLNLVSPDHLTSVGSVIAFSIQLVLLNIPFTSTEAIFTVLLKTHLKLQNKTVVLL